MLCYLCLRPAPKDKRLCKKCSRRYILDKQKGYIRRKRNRRRSISKAQKALAAEMRKIYGHIDEEVYFLDNTSPKGALLHYDIYIPHRNIVIEYDGIQHDTWIKFFHRRKRDFLYQQQMDKIKNKYAKKNHITLIRIRSLEKKDGSKSRPSEDTM